jgi:hypothetical protein
VVSAKVEVIPATFVVEPATVELIGGEDGKDPATVDGRGGVVAGLPAKVADTGGLVALLPAKAELRPATHAMRGGDGVERPANRAESSFEAPVQTARVPVPPAMPSFDVVSQVQHHEVDNAFNQATKEIAQRYDFKDTGTELEKTAEGIVIRSSSDDRAKAALVVLQDKLVKRKVSLRYTDPGKPEPTGKGGSRITVKIKEGIEVEKARSIVSLIKESKLKVQASIMESQVRISGKNKDDLQGAIRLLRGQDLGIELQFVNMRD